MYQIMHCDWLPERTRWRCLTARDYTLFPAKTFSPCSRQIHQTLYNILNWPSLFGQDGSILASFFFCLFMDLDFVSVNKQAEKELGQYPAILTSRLVRTVRTCPGCSDHMARTSSNAADIDARSNYAHFTYATLMTNTFNASTWKSNLRCGLFFKCPYG